uniref:Midasin n=1 Tax=Ditylenchus dipsaci TaxID=166011 RepID=A0A915DGN9_9BILA
MSQDSEYSDLIGGYKPVSLSNLNFLDHVNNCLSSDDFETFLQLVCGSVTSSLKSKEAADSSIEWREIGDRAQRLSRCFESGRKLPAVPFAYVQGIVSEAADKGYWLLIDEINLATAECLDAIVQVLDPAIQVDRKFRLFACMNPATDVGKKYLPPSVRSKFTEFYVQDTTEMEEEVCADLPRKYSLRTLCRALALIAENAHGNPQTSLVTGLIISFTSNLNSEEQVKLLSMISKYFGKLPELKSVENSLNYKNKSYVVVEGSHIKRGAVDIKKDKKYIFTPSVRANLAFLASVVATGRFPVLLEGETSAGKTSIIQHLAKISGNRIFRINNHEQTDVQEGRLEFVEGVLLRAVRNGDWIILDELNLAPPAVLEALNRLLDDNREIFVPELNLAVAAHPRFQLFATQNPVGSYAGRKRLSRAFQNRFVIIKYDHLPFMSCPKSPRRIKIKKKRFWHFFVFQWINDAERLVPLGNRAAMTHQENCYDWRQTLADQGYFVLGSRCRSVEDERTVVEVLEKQLKRNIDVKSLFSCQSKYLPEGVLEQCQSSQIVLNYSMCRMLILLSEAWKCNEAVLLVGQTGTGKTTAAHILDQSLLSINCNERTETSDFLGSIRPSSDGLFQWNDGVVLRAMKDGRKLLIDEISLAPDSVLERLNSLLEPERSILPMDGVNSEIVKASADFQILATMNPGDDHGKKELSKALRNRFLEVWCPSEYSLPDTKLIIEKRISGANFENELTQRVTNCFVLFLEYFTQNHGHLFRNTITTRDLKIASPNYSFLNRFTSIFVEELSPTDFVIVLRRQCGQFLSLDIIEKMVAVNNAISNHSIGEGGPFEFNLRDLLRWASATKEFDVRFGFEMVYLKRVTKEQDVIAVREIFDRFFGADSRFIATVPLPLATDRCIRFGTAQLDVIPPDIAVVETNIKKKSFCLLASQSKLLQQLAACVSLNWLCLITGDCNSGKRSTVEILAILSNRRLSTMRLTAETDAIELLGSYEQLSTSASGAASSIQFKWQNSEFVEAYMSGRWILIEDVNCCSSAVLDCLNACLEDGGHLVVPGHSVDDGSIIKKHRDFRAFFTMDPKNGKLSRAMRNRSVEFFVVQESQWNRNPSDAVSVVFRQDQSLFDNIARGAVEWIRASSSVELLQYSAMVSSSDMNAGMVTGMHSSSPQLMLVPRPIIDLNLPVKGGLSKCLSDYYWVCWCEVARISGEPIPAFVFALLTSSSDKRQDTCELGEPLMHAVKEYLQKYISCSGIDDVHKLFQIRSSSSVMNAESCSIDFLRLLRSIRNSAVTERFIQMFPTDNSMVIQEIFSDVLKKYQMSAPFKSFEDCEFFIQNAVSLPFNSGEEVPLKNSLMSFSNDFEEFAQILCVLCRTTVSTGLSAQGQLVDFLKYIPWKNQDVSEAFSMLEVLNYRFNFHSSLKINVLDFLSLPSYQTVIANKFCSAFWTLTFIRKDIEAKKRLRLCELNDRFCSGEQKLSNTKEVTSLIEFATTSFLLLQAVTPPFGLVDPALSDQVQSDYGKETLHYVGAYFSSLKNFLLLTTGSCDELLLEHHGNPVMHSLHLAKKETLNFLGKLSNPSDSFTFYRPPSATFKELHNNLALRDFCSGARIVTSSIALLPARLSVFLQTCESFKQQLAKKFFGFVDLTTMYISALNVLLLGVHRVLSVVNAEVRNRHVYENQSLSKFSLNLRDTSTGTEVLRQAISSDSSLPAHLQLEAVLCHLQHHCDVSSDLLQWIESKWRMWYERYSSKKDSLYVFKARKIDDAEDSVQDSTDPEEIELRHYLPDFSREGALENSGPISYGNSELSGGQIMTIFEVLLGQFSASKCHEHEKISYHSLMRILDNLQCYEDLDNNSDLLEYFHLIYLRKAAESLGGRASKSSEAISNVYAEGDQKEYFRAMNAILELEKCVVGLHHEFPENAVLSELLDRIQSFGVVNVNAPLMKAATLLEKVLTQANEWQQLADRSRSIQPQMLALQEILMDWRRMEVLCWSEIISRMEMDFEETAVLSSWPIFESFEKLASSTNDSQLVCNDEKILLMLIEWIHSSTLGDFDARLKSAELLIRFLEIKVAMGLGTANKFSSTLILRIKSLIRHFKTFSGALRARFSKAKVDVQQQLKNFVDIFKYSDLNLWSIKQSTQKAHAQLFKIIKCFKANCQEPVVDFLLNVMPQLPSPFSIQGIVLPQISTSSKFQIVAERMRCIFSLVIDHAELDRLRSESESFLSLLNQNVSYDGFDDETKEKLQGRALFERQRKFAFLIRGAAQVGLSSRRGLQISSEELTSSSVTRVFVEENDMGRMIRFSAVARNVFLKKFAAAKISQQEHLQKQVPVHVLTHLKGISEYGLHWMVSASQLLVEKILGQKEYFGHMSNGFRLIMKNCEYSDFDYKTFAIAHSQNTIDLRTLAYWTDVLEQVVLCCPKERCSSSFLGQINDLALSIGSNPLALITKSTDDYEELIRAIDSVKRSLGRLSAAHIDCQPKRFGLSDAGQVRDYMHCEEMSGVCLDWSSRIQISQYSNCDFPLLDTPQQSITAILLKVQQLVNCLSQVVDEKSTKKIMCLDSLREIIQLFYRLDLEEAKSELTKLLLQISSSAVKVKYETVKVAYELSSDLNAMMEFATGWFSLFFQLFSSFYINIEAIGCRILTDGFVNPIPKIQEGQSENTKESNETTESNCGMGEGTGGEEDVSSQIENSGQIEGLKGDKSDEPDEPENETAKEGNQPIETEDEFAANLEDIDGEINDGTEEQEGFENQVEWDKGQVEEADEQQLDPKLWEEPSADESKETESAQDEGDWMEKWMTQETKGVDEDLSNDVNEKGLKSPADEECMEVDDGSETQIEEIDQLMDESAAIDDGENSCEGDMTEKTEEPPVDDGQDAAA